MIRIQAMAIVLQNMQSYVYGKGLELWILIENSIYIIDY